MTKEMVDALGISETHLRWLEKKGVVPKADRDHANRRKWRRKDVAKLGRRLLGGRAFAPCGEP